MPVEPAFRPIRFVHRGRVVEVADAEPTRTALDWLREDARCTGTKEGCNEGDCGACTVVVGALDDASPDGLALRSANACLLFVPALDGKALFTVEDLAPIAAAAGIAAGADGAAPLHPVQRALVECHGSQCGFCTPGFAMSLWGVYEAHRRGGAPAALGAADAPAGAPGRQAMADALAGNLCRCTGYRSILDAAARMFELPPAPLDPRPVVDALRTLASDPALHYSPDGDGDGDGDGAAAWHSPRTLDDLAALRERHPDATLVAGATDVALWVNKRHRALPRLISTLGVAELARIDEARDGALRIGAAASLEDAWRALARRHPDLLEIGMRFASPPVRHAGTLGGNVANGSPIGDGAPVLIALGARLALRHGAARRHLPLEDFYVDYMKNALAPGELVEAIEVPAAPAGRIVRGWKVSKRYDSDISAVSAGFALTLGDDGAVADVVLAWGGMAAIVKRARGAEGALRGRPWNEASVEAALAALDADFAPLTDMRASASYRRRVAGNLLRRLWLETRADAPLPPHASRVFTMHLPAAAGR